MEFRILGPLEAADGGRPLPLGGGKARALLALLLLNANEVVSSDRIVDELWAEPPPTAAKIVQNAVSQLRRTLGDGRLETRGRGYVLHLEPGELDVDRFADLVDEGRRAPNPEQAARILRDALALWRGPPLSELETESFVRDAAGRLVEWRLVALEERIEADLARGEHAALVGELESLVVQHPLRERLRGQLMLALYRAGRQAEALAAYQATRRTLVDELGLEPGPALQDLERAILVHDPSLRAPERGRERARRRGRATVVAAVGTLVALGVASGLVFAFRDTPPTESAAVAENSVAVIDARTNGIVGDVRVGLRPAGVALGEGGVWVANEDGSTVSRIDPKSRAVTTIQIGAHADDIAVGSGAVWVANGSDESVTRIDSHFGSVQDSIDLRGSTSLTPQPVFAVATGDDGVWVTSGAHRVLRIDPATDANVALTTVSLSPLAIAYGEEAVWIASARRLSRLEPATNAVTGSAPVPGAAAVAAGHGYVWLIVPGELHGELWRFDPSSLNPTATVQVGLQPSGIAIGEDGSIWVANSGDGTVSRVDPFTATVVATIKLGERPTGIAAGDRKVWVTVDRPE